MTALEIMAAAAMPPNLLRREAARFVGRNELLTRLLLDAAERLELKALVEGERRQSLARWKARDAR